MSAGHTTRHCAGKGCANEAAYGSWCVECVQEFQRVPRKHMYGVPDDDPLINADNGGFWYGMEERI